MAAERSTLSGRELDRRGNEQHPNEEGEPGPRRSKGAKLTNGFEVAGQQGEKTGDRRQARHETRRQDMPQRPLQDRSPRLGRAKLLEIG